MNSLPVTAGGSFRTYRMWTNESVLSLVARGHAEANLHFDSFAPASVGSFALDTSSVVVYFSCSYVEHSFHLHNSRRRSGLAREQPAAKTQRGRFWLAHPWLAHAKTASFGSGPAINLLSLRI